MNVLSRGQFLPLDCSYKCGHRKGERFEAKADNLVGVSAHSSVTYLFPT